MLHVYHNATIDSIYDATINILHDTVLYFVDFVSIYSETAPNHSYTPERSTQSILHVFYLCQIILSVRLSTVSMVQLPFPDSHHPPLQY